MDDQPGRRLSLVLPACNEEAGIRRAVVEADDALGQLCDNYEILIVDDGSRDGTALIVAGMAKHRPHVHLLQHPVNRGYGAALRSGFEAAKFERVAFTDADCQFDLADLKPLLELTDEHAVAVGWRIDRKDPWRRRFLSRGYNLLARTLFGTRVRDVDCALKVYRREALTRLLPEAFGFFVNTEMLTRARQLGMSVAEIGVRHRPRLAGQSTVTLWDVPRTLGTVLPFWWTRVMFASHGGQEAGGTTEHSRAEVRRSPVPVLLLLLLACCLFFSRLDAPLLEPQESRHAEISRQMLAEHSWLVPVLHGQPYLDKPPLLYWLVMTCYEVFGVRDWVARIVPGLVGVATVFLTWWWGRRALGERAGLLGALLLCLAPRFVYHGRMLSYDGLLALWVVASLACSQLALTGSRLHRRWWLLSAVACGLGILTKGPVALVLIAVPIAIQQWLDSRSARVGALGWFVWLGAAACVAGPWFIAVESAQPGFLAEFFWRHNVVRFVAPFDHQERAWFFVPGLLAGMMPWTLLLPGFCILLGRRSLRTGQRRPAALGFCLLASLWGFAFFSAAGCKRATYVLPVLPPLALALGWYVDQLLVRPGWSALWQRGSGLARWTGTAALAAGSLVAAAAGVTGILSPNTAGGLGALSIGAALLVVARRRQITWATCGVMTCTMLFLGVLLLQPAYNRRFAVRARLLAHAPLTEQIPVLCYPQRWDSVSFYLPDANVRVYGRGEREQLIADLRWQPEAVLLIKSGRLLQELLQELPASVEFVASRRQGMVTVGWLKPREGPDMHMLAQVEDEWAND